MRVLDPTQHRYIAEATLEYAEAPGDEFPVRTPGGDWFVLRPLTGQTRPLQEDDKLNLQVRLHEALLDQIDRYENDFSTTPITEGLDDKNILKAIFVIGSGGSGKSSIADQMFAGTGLKVVNQDRHLERLIKGAGVPMDQIGTRYDLLKKSQVLKDVELRGYGNARIGIIVDSTGWDYPRVAQPAEKLRKLGYDIYLVYVTTSHETALRRNKKRGDEGGRYVPDPYISDAHFGAQKNFPRYKKLFGKKNTFVIDNDKDLTPTEFEAKLGPQLRRIGNTIMSRPLQNSKGKQWRETARQTLNDPKRDKDWKKPRPPKLTQQPIGKLNTRTSKQTPKGSGEKVSGSKMANLFNRFLTGNVGSSYGRAKKRVNESLHGVNTTTVEVAPPGYADCVRQMQEQQQMTREDAVRLAWVMFKKSKA